MRVIDFSWLAGHFVTLTLLALIPKECLGKNSRKLIPNQREKFAASGPQRGYERTHLSLMLHFANQ
jgi:hypothetical protein